MKLHSLRIANFRAFLDEEIFFDDYTCLVGCNGSGKSTLLYALNIFFRESSFSKTDVTLLEEEDFHKRDTTKPIRITVTFTNLTPEEQSDFSHYYRGDQLAITSEATWDPALQKAIVKQYGQRLGMEPFARFFEADSDGAKVDELKQIYSALCQMYADLPKAATKPSMIDALRTYEEAHPELAKLLPSEDSFYGFTKGANKLERFIQWVYIPAVKDATEEGSEAKNTALGKLLARTVRAKVNFVDPINAIRSKAQQDYAKLVDEHQSLLDDLSVTLKERLAEWSHPDVNMRVLWQQEPEKAIKIEEPIAKVLAGEGLFEGNLTRFGHGLQRSFLLALLQELASGGDESQPRLILACEEPELFQHPPQARHLATVLKRLSEANSQVVLCTHSPYFISGEDFSCVRLVRKNRQSSIAKIYHATPELLDALCSQARGTTACRAVRASTAKIHQSLTPELNEMFFAQMLILVEGPEDVACLTTYFHLCGLWDEFRRLGCHIVPTQSKSKMLQPRAIAHLLQIPTYTIFDSDGDKYSDPSNNHYNQHLMDNTALLTLCGHPEADTFPHSHLWLPNCTVWSSNIGDAFRDDVGQQNLQTVKSRVEIDYGQPGGMEKNVLFLSDMITSAWESGIRSSVFQRLCKEIIAFARASYEHQESQTELQVV
ncbi:MAG: ATP-dependent nuclease [Armatimonadota bacterium]